ncbi:hypothetical protein Tco_0751384 [Tanacetum coccineum]|uniref:Uncharacterized protein n=1 Tax=Tanacetum coccineum TaxID=301880 RepID=A0ABQ4Z7D2_9ASTR
MQAATRSTKDQRRIGKRKPMEVSEVGDRVMSQGPHPGKESVNELRNFLRYEQVHHHFHEIKPEEMFIPMKPLVKALEGIHVDDKLQFMEETCEIMEREIND